MGWQEIATYVLVGAAAGWLAVRWWKRRLSGNCCGQAECPAAKGMADKLQRLARETKEPAARR